MFFQVLLCIISAFIALVAICLIVTNQRLRDTIARQSQHLSANSDTMRQQAVEIHNLRIHRDQLTGEKLDLAVQLNDERVNSNELGQLNHKMGVALIDSETARIAAQNRVTQLNQELTRLHQRFNNLQNGPAIAPAIAAASLN